MSKENLFFILLSEHNHIVCDWTDQTYTEGDIQQQFKSIDITLQLIDCYGIAEYFPNVCVNVFQ